jgi:hypothetical protein
MDLDDSKASWRMVMSNPASKVIKESGSGPLHSMECELKDSEGTERIVT